MTSPLPPFIRLRDLVNHPARNGRPPTKGIVPMAQSAWLRGVARNEYPAPVKLGPGITAWRGQDIQALLDRWSGKGGAE